MIEEIREQRHAFSPDIYTAYICDACSKSVNDPIHWEEQVQQLHNRKTCSWKRTLLDPHPCGDTAVFSIRAYRHGSSKRTRNFSCTRHLHKWVDYFAKKRIDILKIVLHRLDG